MHVYVHVPNQTVNLQQMQLFDQLLQSKSTMNQRLVNTEPVTETALRSTEINDKLAS